MFRGINQKWISKNPMWSLSCERRDCHTPAYRGQGGRSEQTSIPMLPVLQKCFPVQISFFHLKGIKELLYITMLPAPQLCLSQHLGEEGYSFFIFYARCYPHRQ